MIVAKSSTQEASTLVINNYKMLLDFEQEVAEGSVEAYHLGFFDCKEHIAYVYP